VPSYEFPSEGQPNFLEQYGPLLPVRLTVPVKRKRYLEQHGFEPHASKTGYALIDPGATVSAVHDRVMQELEIPVLDQTGTNTPHGPGLSNIYNASLSFAEMGMLDVPLEGVLGCYLGEPEIGEPEIIMLLGRDLLRHFVMSYDGPNARMTITL